MYNTVVELLEHKTVFSNEIQHQLLESSNDIMTFVDSKSPSFTSNRPTLDIAKIYRKDLLNFQNAVDSVIETENITQQLDNIVRKPKSIKQNDEIEQHRSVVNKNLCDSLTKALKVPIDDILKRIPGIVRAVIDDLKQQGIEKQVHIEISGRDIVVDKYIYNLS